MKNKLTLQATRPREWPISSFLIRVSGSRNTLRVSFSHRRPGSSQNCTLYLSWNYCLTISPWQRGLLFREVPAVHGQFLGWPSQIPSAIPPSQHPSHPFSCSVVFLPGVFSSWILTSRHRPEVIRVLRTQYTRKWIIFLLFLRQAVPLIWMLLSQTVMLQKYSTASDIPWIY